MTTDNAERAEHEAYLIQHLESAARRMKSAHKSLLAAAWHYAIAQEADLNWPRNDALPSERRRGAQHLAEANTTLKRAAIQRYNAHLDCAEVEAALTEYRTTL